MWYLITAGAGVLIGLGLLIFGLRERSKRHAAERKADAAEEARKAFQTAAEANAEAAQEAEQAFNRLEGQTAVLRKSLEEAQMRLAKGGDPAAIKKWLDLELKAEEL